MKVGCQPEKAIPVIYPTAIAAFSVKRKAALSLLPVANGLQEHVSTLGKCVKAQKHKVRLLVP